MFSCLGDPTVRMITSELEALRPVGEDVKDALSGQAPT
jgi:hypothetical protein